MAFAKDVRTQRTCFYADDVRLMFLSNSNVRVCKWDGISWQFCYEIHPNEWKKIGDYLNGKLV